MPRVTVTTDYCEVIEQLEITSGNFKSAMSRAALLDELHEAVERAEEIQAEQEKDDE